MSGLRQRLGQLVVVQGDRALMLTSSTQNMDRFVEFAWEVLSRFSSL